MLEANSQTLTVTANTDITFANINIQTGITAVLDSDNATIRLNRPGIYRETLPLMAVAPPQGPLEHSCMPMAVP